MTSEWIRPDGCEGGACVEYRIVNGRVFLRSSEDDDMIQFSVAEWDALVASLVAPVAAERDKLYESLATECAQAESLAAESASWRRVAERLQRELNEANGSLTELAPSSLAAENARLRQQLDHERESYGRLALKLDDVASERNRALTSFESLEKTTADAINLSAAETRRAERARHNAVTWHGQWVRAQAEVEVLRHRDRRTQAVVRAAKAWLAHRRSPEAFTRQPRAELIRLADALDALDRPDAAFRAANPGDTPGELVPGEGDLAEDPAAALRATESAEQPQPALPTDGPEPQGEAQAAAGPSRVWDKGEGPVAWLHVPPRKPRVWNAGDPEPEGVTRVRDCEGDVWTRRERGWSITSPDGYLWSVLMDDYGPLAEVLPEPTVEAPDLTAKAHRISSLIDAKLGNVTKPAVDQFDDGSAPEYREPDGHYPPDSGTMVCNKCGGDIWTGDDGWACSCDGAMFEYAKPTEPVFTNTWPEATRTNAGTVKVTMATGGIIPAGTKFAVEPVPEAGRAGEAQTITDGTWPEPTHEPVPVPHVRGRFGEPVAVRTLQDQDRTEVGLDAAIEAVANEIWAHDDSCLCPPGADLPCPEVVERVKTVAARLSPLIERAALNAAADAIAACKRCGKEHFLRTDKHDPRLYGTWADPEDGHPYERTGPESMVMWLRDRATRTETP